MKLLHVCTVENHFRKQYFCFCVLLFELINKLFELKDHCRRVLKMMSVCPTLKHVLNNCTL